MSGESPWVTPKGRLSAKYREVIGELEARCVAVLQGCPTSDAPEALAVEIIEIADALQTIRSIRGQMRLLEIFGEDMAKHLFPDEEVL